jgi:phage baseplate assembly protein W
MSSDQAFLGTGWSFPPTFSQGGADVQMVSGVEDIQQSLQILLTTSLGERVMQDKFGCDLSSIMFEEVDQRLANSINNIITDALLYYEPRITLDNVDVSDNKIEQGLILIAIKYTVRGTNSRFNMVYPFYINEATRP